MGTGHFSHPHTSYPGKAQSLLSTHFSLDIYVEEVNFGKNQQLCIQLCKLYKDSLRDQENFLSSGSLNDCSRTRRVLLLIHRFASLQLFHCMLSNDQMTNLQERKLTPGPNRWKRPLDGKSQFFTSGKLTKLEQAIFFLHWI